MFSYLVIFFLQTLVNLHPFHVSVADVVVNQEKRAIQISQRIFLDDLEQALNNTFGTQLIIDNESNNALRDSLIEQYLVGRLSITVDGKKKDSEFLGSEFEEDGIWCYLEIKGVKKIKQLVVASTILFEEFDDQANIIHFKINEYEKSVKLDRDNWQIIFTIPKD